MPIGPHLLFARFETCQTHHPLRLNDFTEAGLGLSTMSSAQLEIHPLDEASAESEAALAPFALKEQVAERLAAHRARHGQRPPQHPLPSPAPPLPKPRAARIAATVAERYAHSPSYRAFLAAEAERAIHEAEAAARGRRPQRPGHRRSPEPAPRRTRPVDRSPLPTPVRASRLQTRSRDWHLSSRLLPRRSPAPASPSVSTKTQPHYPRTLQRSFPAPYAHQNQSDRHRRRRAPPSMRRSPSASLPSSRALEPTVDIPANLIEFPRQLVASRRARPRLAEGPLREEADHYPRRRAAPHLRGRSRPDLHRAR